MTNVPKKIFTIGHSSHEIVCFVGLLHQHHIDAVADVRSMPYSRRQPQFNRDNLGTVLKKHGIAYRFLGKALGGRSDDPKCYENGRIQYQKLAKTKEFRLGIRRIIDGSQRMCLALMCAEQDPLDCHRTILVARELVERGRTVYHILRDGEIETHQDTIQRLCNRFKKSQPGQSDIFQIPEKQDNLADLAYEKQEKRIAYKEGHIVEA